MSLKKENQLGHTTSVSSKKFTHIDSSGSAKMVDVGSKKNLRRVAVAQGRIHVGCDVLSSILDQTMKKGDVLKVSQIAGIMGSKMTSSLIPLCHQVPLDMISVDIKPDQPNGFLIVEAKVEATYKTGVEIESLTAVTVTLLTIYDMCKSINKGMIISDIKLLSKTKNGH